MHSLPTMTKLFALTAFFTRRPFLSISSWDPSVRGIIGSHILEKVVPRDQLYNITSLNFPFFTGQKLISLTFGLYDNGVRPFLEIFRQKRKENY